MSGKRIWVCTGKIVGSQPLVDAVVANPSHTGWHNSEPREVERLNKGCLVGVAEQESSL